MMAAVGEVADAAFERQRFTAIEFLAMTFDPHQCFATEVIAFGRLIQELVDVDEFDILMDVRVFDGLQGPLDHHLQVIQILIELTDLLFVFQKLHA